VENLLLHIQNRCICAVSGKATPVRHCGLFQIHQPHQEGFLGSRQEIQYEPSQVFVPYNFCSCATCCWVCTWVCKYRALICVSEVHDGYFLVLRDLSLCILIGSESCSCWAAANLEAPHTINHQDEAAALYPPSRLEATTCHEWTKGNRIRPLLQRPSQEYGVSPSIARHERAHAAPKTTSTRVERSSSERGRGESAGGLSELCRDNGGRAEARKREKR